MDITSHVDLWKIIVKHGGTFAAAGHLRDVFARLSAYESITPTPDSAGRLNDGRAGLREQAMAMIDDQDGQKIRDWVNLYKADAHQERFMEAATAWADHCCTYSCDKDAT